jgi:hypothetical protein
MRKIEQAMIRAIADCPADRIGRIFKDGNTEVTRYCEDGFSGFRVKLYNTVIAAWEDGKPDEIVLNHGDWRTVTTKSRINAILDHLYGPAVGVSQRDGRWFVAGYQWQDSRFVGRFDHRFAHI